MLIHGSHLDLRPMKIHTSRRAASAWWLGWWRRLPPARQDRFATLGPVVAVFVFMAAIVMSMTYLRIDELEREQEAVTRDVEYAQQRIRLRLLERQEELMRMARDTSTQAMEVGAFVLAAEAMVGRYPEILALSWVDARRVVKASYLAASAPLGLQRVSGQALESGEQIITFDNAKVQQQPVYSQPIAHNPND